MIESRNADWKQRWQAVALSLSALMLLGFLLLALPAHADLEAKFKPSGAGGCGNFIDDIGTAEDGDVFLLMTPPQLSQGAPLTRSIVLQGGWSPPTDGCDSSDSAYTTTADLFAAGFTFDGPTTRSTLSHDTGPVLTLSPQVVTLTLQHLILEHTASSTLRGGGITGVISGGAEVRLENLVVEQSIVGEDGGGIYLEVRGGSRLVISDSLFVSNEAQHGGAFEIRLYDNSDLVIHNTEVRSNLASAGNGGGGRILVESGSVSITNSTFDDNQAAQGAGGGLSIEKTGAGAAYLLLNDNTFTNNRAGSDAGLHLEGDFIFRGNYFRQLFVPVMRDALAARITSITLQGSSYRVLFETQGFTPQLPGMHVHFFFNTVPPEQAGLPGSGPWFVYGGPSPFTGYGPANRPAGATQMCVLVANPNHSVQQGTGNCLALP